MPMLHLARLSVCTVAVAFGPSPALAQVPGEPPPMAATAVETALGITINGMAGDYGGFGLEGSVATNRSPRVSLVGAVSVWGPTFRSDGSVVSESRPVWAYLGGVKIRGAFRAPNRQGERRRFYATVLAGLEHSGLTAPRLVAEIGGGMDAFPLIGRRGTRQVAGRIEYSHRLAIPDVRASTGGRLFLGVVFGPRFERR